MPNLRPPQHRPPSRDTRTVLQRIRSGAVGTADIAEALRAERAIWNATPGMRPSVYRFLGMTGEEFDAYIADPATFIAGLYASTARMSAYNPRATPIGAP